MNVEFVIFDDIDSGPVIRHVGTPHEGAIPHSGRYAWGSGKNAFQHPKDFLDRVEKERNYIRTHPNDPEGRSEQKRLADALGMSIREMRSEISLAKNAERQEKYALCKKLSDQGLSSTDISKKTGLPESSVRSYLNETIAKRQAITQSTIDVLANGVKEHGYIDVGDGVAEGLGITKTRLDTAVAAMKNEGYTLENIYVKQATGKGYTTVKVLAAPGTTKDDIYKNRENIGVLNVKFQDPNGRSVLGLDPVKSISSKRIEICYAEQGGVNKDGVIELRRGVKGLDMGEARYAQVRIGVDGKYYLKGMAIYSDDLPDGVDIRFNTNKHEGTPKEKVFKSMETKKDGSIDTDNPFGSLIKAGGQRGYLNIVREEGDWTRWSKTLSSQMLSKQPVALAKQQLDLAKRAKQQEFEEIMSLTNPTLKKHLLDEFAGGCDTAARNLKAAAMPGQTNKVILPVNSMKENQIYAPGYANGTEVVLIRHPHGGLFEIPSLIVNNKNKEAKALFENARDAVGIHPKVAAQLSGADFDGDTVLVIPNPTNGRRIKYSKPIKDLQSFDPKEAYPHYAGMKVISSEMKQKQMGVASNLITDMTIRNAPTQDIVRAVKFSMVVIDSEKHKLDWRRAEKELGIEELRQKYQPRPDKEAAGKDKPYGGASTLISRSKSVVYVPERKESYRANPETGERVYYETGGGYYTDTGKWKGYKSKTTQMDQAKDAMHLSSGSAIEVVYADYANTMKSLANQARKEALSTKPASRNPEMAKKYIDEVQSLDAKLKEARAHAPAERKAQLYADYITRMKKADDPDMDKEEKTKIQRQSISEARARLGISRPPVEITDREWEAIQAGAISSTKQAALFNYADSDRIKERAMPKSAKQMTPTKVARAKALKKAGYSLADIAKQLGVSQSALDAALYG